MLGKLVGRRGPGLVVERTCLVLALQAWLAQLAEQQQALAAWLAKRHPIPGRLGCPRLLPVIPMISSVCVGCLVFEPLQ